MTKDYDNDQKPDAILSINASLGCHAAAEVVGTLEDRVKESMRAVIAENWMETKQVKLFQAAVAGALMTCETEDDDYVQIVDSIDALRKVGALIELSKLGFKAATPELGMRATLPLYQWWHEVFAATKSKIKLEGQ